MTKHTNDVFEKHTNDVFELKAEHLKLLSRAYVGWSNCETGAPKIDPKRPYGNSDVVGDVAEILGLQGHRCPHCDGNLNEDDDSDDLMQLHRETETALQIILSRLGTDTPPGTYTRVGSEYSKEPWKQL